MPLRFLVPYWQNSRKVAAKTQKLKKNTKKNSQKRAHHISQRVSCSEYKIPPFVVKCFTQNQKNFEKQLFPIICIFAI